MSQGIVQHQQGTGKTSANLKMQQRFFFGTCVSIEGENGWMFGCLLSGLKFLALGPHSLHPKLSDSWPFTPQKEILMFQKNEFFSGKLPVS